MSFETKFSQDITNFQRYGTYTYESDEVGNVIFNSASNDFSQVFFAFPLPNFVYDNTKIVAFYDPTFVEFVPPTATAASADSAQLQGDLDAANQENAALQQQLDAAIAINESTPSVADNQAAKQVILELRKSLGQGGVDSDFSSDFPYMPIKKESNITSATTTQPTTGVNNSQTELNTGGTNAIQAGSSTSTIPTNSTGGTAAPSSTTQTPPSETSFFSISETLARQAARRNQQDNIFQRPN
jgi:hypothetical protein